MSTRPFVSAFTAAHICTARLCSGLSSGRLCECLSVKSAARARPRMRISAAPPASAELTWRRENLDMLASPKNRLYQPHASEARIGPFGDVIEEILVGVGILPRRLFAGLARRVAMQRAFDDDVV